MREYLFRGQRIDSKEWVYGYLLGNRDSMDKAWITASYYGIHYEVIAETVGMWTGRTDKKEVKIFQGDISQDGGVVIWNQDDASFCWHYKGMEVQSMGEENIWCEISGNIHQQTKQP